MVGTHTFVQKSYVYKSRGVLNERRTTAKLGDDDDDGSTVRRA